MDVMLTLVANQALSDGVAPDRQRIRGEFPYFGDPYTHDEQHGVSPAAQPTTNLELQALGKRTESSAT